MKYYLVYFIGSTTKGNHNAGLAEYDNLRQVYYALEELMDRDRDAKYTIIQGEAVFDSILSSQKWV